MTPLNAKEYLVDIEGTAYCASARRLYEHITLGQINPFERSFSSIRSQSDIYEMIDVMQHDHGYGYRLTGLTLAQLNDEAACAGKLGPSADVVRQAILGSSVQNFVAAVETDVKRHAKRRASRNVPAQFLPPHLSGDLFGVRFLRSKLYECLLSNSRVKASTAQWIGTIRNLSSKGFRVEELQRSKLIEFLAPGAVDSAQRSGEELAGAIDFSLVRISVIANVNEARTQLRFEALPKRTVAKIKGEPRPQSGQRRQLYLFDRALGYRIEEVFHASLWGENRHWQAVTFAGSVLINRTNQRSIFDSASAAISCAQEHAREVLPKLLASERWVNWSWTGGEEYREWLITLPWFPNSFFANHFDVRNILSHVRCDFREGKNGEKVLMLHEVQSDWMQSARRHARENGMMKL